MATLSSYTTDFRDIVRDPNSNFYTSTQATNWINKARSKAAQVGQCVRYMPAAAASLSSVVVTNGGSGYSAATATVSGPDAVDGGGQAPQTAEVSVQIMAGQISSITVTVPGRGYVKTPTITITGDGTGAEATAVLTPHVTTTPGRELFLFSDLNTIIGSTVPGLGSVIGIQNISVSWGNQRPTLAHMDFSALQAYLRATSIGMQNYPQVWAQYGQGNSGSFYLWPVPAQVSQLEVDCYCDVLPLSTVQTVDLIPDMFSDAVPYYAAHLAFINAQRFADANDMRARFDQKILEARAAASPAMIPTMYPGA